MRICILVHLSKLEDYDDMVNAIRNITADVYFGVVYGWKHTLDECVDFICSKVKQTSYKFVLVENNNLTDSNSFLECLKNISSDDYEYVIKIHNKTNLKDREKSLEFLKWLDQIIDVMDKDQSIGMVGTFIETLDPKSKWNEINEEHMSKIRTILNLKKSTFKFNPVDYKLYNPDLKNLEDDLLIDHYCEHGRTELRGTSIKTGTYVIVTMFICRLNDIKMYFTTENIDKILKLGEKDVYISGQNDKSTPAHAMERIYGNIFMEQKYVVSLNSITT